MPSVDVCLSPLLFPLFDVRGKVVVVIDILRATTTICTALHYGVKSIVPVASLDDCMRYKDSHKYLAAERNGHKVEGFLLGNSPFDYMVPELKGQTVIFTTTNGTRAFRMSTGAKAVVGGAFSNLNKLTEWLQKQQKDVVLFCSGWKDQFSMEDTLFAGAVVQQLQNFEIDSDPALAALQLYEKASADIMEAIKNASHYKRLANLGVEKDIEYCLTGPQFPVLPVFLNDEIVPLIEN